MIFGSCLSCPTLPAVFDYGTVFKINIDRVDSSCESVTINFNFVYFPNAPLENIYTMKKVTSILLILNFSLK